MTHSQSGQRRPISATSGTSRFTSPTLTACSQTQGAADCRRGTRPRNLAAKPLPIFARAQALPDQPGRQGDEQQQIEAIEEYRPPPGILSLAARQSCGTAAPVAQPSRSAHAPGGAPPFFMWQFLNFLPLPQGQGSLRPTRSSRLRIGSGLRSACGAFDGGLLLARRCSLVGRGLLVDGLAFDPGRADETLVELFHAEDQVGDPLADAWSTSARRSACPRACTRPWDRPGRSRAGRRCGASGPSPAGGLSRPCRAVAAPAPAPSAAFRAGSGLRPPWSAGSSSASRSQPGQLLGRQLVVERLGRANRSATPVAPLLPWRRAASLGGCVGRTACSSRCCDLGQGRLGLGCCGRLCSTSRPRISSRCLLLQVFQVQVDLEPLAGPGDQPLAVVALLAARRRGW